MNHRDAVEHFHLVFLRHFAAVASPGTICLKGGVNLRLFLNSPRLSEDIDFDARKVGVEILKKNVGKVLGARPFLTELAAAGITLGETNAVKQTATVQRWKLQIVFDGMPVPTRLEFSRRNEKPFEHCKTEMPSAALLAAHQVVPFVFNHYGPEAAYAGKVTALAGRAQVQARDIFDLHHLARFAPAAKQVAPEVISQALEQLHLVNFEMFNDQVVPYLPADLAAHHGTPDAWEKMSATVEQNLISALRTGTVDSARR